MTEVRLVQNRHFSSIASKMSSLVNASLQALHALNNTSHKLYYTYKISS